jgi:hypothetical protein
MSAAAMEEAWDCVKKLFTLFDRRRTGILCLCVREQRLL